MTPFLATTKQASHATGLSISLLNKLRIYRPEESPPYVKVGRKVLYPLTGPNSLETWVAARVQGGAAPL